MTTPTPVEVTELKPCPFCGSDELSHGWSSPGLDGSSLTSNVECHNCNALIWVNDTEAEAIKAWNTRHRTEALASAAGEEEEAYRLGIDEGRQEMVREIDLATGGDGEFRFCTIPDDRHCPDAEAMKARVLERFAPLASQRALVEALEAENAG